MVRRRALPPGWYPRSAAEIRSQCDLWSQEGASSGAQRDSPDTTAFGSVVVPHAGWSYSGRLAYHTLRRLHPAIETLVVVGGHLRPSDPVVIAYEDSFETPIRDLDADREARDAIALAVGSEPDVRADNTVEIHLPLIAAIFDGIRVVCLRCPPSKLSFRLAEGISAFADSTKRKVGVVGSTDLTHYGPAYGFTPRGHGRDAIEFVKETNDKRIVEALLRSDAEETVRLALAEQSACSSGAAATAVAFARLQHMTNVEKIDYYTSYDVQTNDSFVGYVGIGYGPLPLDSTSTHR